MTGVFFFFFNLTLNILNYGIKVPSNCMFLRLYIPHKDNLRGSYLNKTFSSYNQLSQCEELPLKHQTFITSFNNE